MKYLKKDISRCIDQNCPWREGCRRWLERNKPDGADLSYVQTFREYGKKKCDGLIPVEEETP